MLANMHFKIKIYKAVMLSFLCGCDTWSDMFGDEIGLIELETRLLRRIFVPRRMKC
jgi:hypothetical protein